MLGEAFITRAGTGRPRALAGIARANPDSLEATLALLRLAHRQDDESRLRRHTLRP
ncbi:MAG: hypothetical protein U5J62_08895 [Desulfurivibrio sp.]|nr:hypothetical protein [Desulfurivibrio sp.]